MIHANGSGQPRDYVGAVGVGRAGLVLHQAAQQAALPAGRQGGAGVFVHGAQHELVAVGRAQPQGVALVAATRLDGCQATGHGRGQAQNGHRDRSGPNVAVMGAPKEAPDGPSVILGSGRQAHRGRIGRPFGYRRRRAGRPAATCGQQGCRTPQPHKKAHSNRWQTEHIR